MSHTHIKRDTCIYAYGVIQNWVWLKSICHTSNCLRQLAQPRGSNPTFNFFPFFNWLIDWLFWIAMWCRLWMNWLLKLTTCNVIILMLFVAYERTLLIIGCVACDKFNFTTHETSFFYKRSVINVFRLSKYIILSNTHTKSTRMNARNMVHNIIEHHY